VRLTAAMEGIGSSIVSLLSSTLGFVLYAPEMLMGPHGALLLVGGIEAVVGLWTLAFPAQALPGIVGRLLSVGAVQSSPALLPSIAQAGALRLAVGVLILAYSIEPTGVHGHVGKVACTCATCPGTICSCVFDACVVAHTCLLQPFVATFRSHSKMPTCGTYALGLIEGGLILCQIILTDDLAVGDPTGTYAAIAFLGCGIVFALISCCTGACAKGAAVAADEEVAGMDLKGSGHMPLFDENRHRLSPTAKRLLA